MFYSTIVRFFRCYGLLFICDRNVFFISSSKAGTPEFLLGHYFRECLGPSCTQRDRGLIFVYVICFILGAKQNFLVKILCFSPSFKVIASLLFADNYEKVEDTYDAEAPLITSYNGLEYASSDTPIKLINGRASFKLKIAQVR